MQRRGGIGPSAIFCLVNAATILVERDPFGPGKVILPGKVLAGKDMVAMDALGCGLLGVKPGEVIHIKMAHECWLVKTDLERRGTRRTAAISPQENSHAIPGRTVCRLFAPLIFQKIHTN